MRNRTLGRRLKNLSKRRSKESSRMNDFLPLLIHLPPLTLKLGIAFLRFKRKVRIASKIFKKELKESGLAKYHAKELALEFEEFASVRKFLNVRSLISNLSK